MFPILIIGQHGQLARALKRSLLARQAPFETAGSAQMDLASNPQAAQTLIEQGNYSAVINCAAYTNVDAAETDCDNAMRLNAIAPTKMAAACAAKDIPFIHISTDYVFDGQNKRPYMPEDLICPINTYGLTKSEGEQGVLAANGQSLVLRTSWLYNGTSSNFLTTMLRLAATKSFLSIIDDQIGRPTYAGHLAEACLTALRQMPKKPKIYHVSNTGPAISWADFAESIFRLKGHSTSVKRITSDEFNSPAPRPAYSVLNVSAFEENFQHPLPSWQEGLKRALMENTQ